MNRGIPSLLLVKSLHTLVAQKEAGWASVTQLPPPGPTAHDGVKLCSRPACPGASHGPASSLVSGLTTFMLGGLPFSDFLEWEGSRERQAQEPRQSQRWLILIKQWIGKLSGWWSQGQGAKRQRD